MRTRLGGCSFPFLAGIGWLIVVIVTIRMIQSHNIHQFFFKSLSLHGAIIINGCAQCATQSFSECFRPQPSRQFSAEGDGALLHDLFWIQYEDAGIAPHNEVVS